MDPEYLHVNDDRITDAQVAASSPVQTDPTQTGDVGSPEWWRDRLRTKLQEQRKAGRLPRAYYEGEHRMPYATEQWRSMFGQVFRHAQDNFLQIVVDSVDERLQVEGFRIPLPDTPAGEVLDGDDQAWAIWQANALDAESQLVHTDALVDGNSAVIVGPPASPGLAPEITGEQADQVYVEHAAGSRRRLAAVKEWRGDDDRLYVTLYLPTEVYKWVSSKPVPAHSTDVTRWEERRGDDISWPLRNLLGVVPVVPFANRPRATGQGGRSEIQQLIPLQDAINKLFMDMLVASEFAGFAQRWATGIERPTDPETNQPIPQEEFLKMAMDRLLTVEDPDARFGSLPATELSNYTTALAAAIQHLASRSSTPPHYFLANMGNFPSGESLKAAETGLVSKVQRRMKHFGESWEEVIRLALQMAGERSKADAAVMAETLWGDPESRSESEHIDAILKMQALGVPDEVLWEKSGMFTPTEIDRMKTLIAAGSPVSNRDNPDVDAASGRSDGEA